MKNKKTALYCRLSKDDERQGESLSIESQKLMLSNYAREHRLMPYKFYVDDGYSGLNFDRPGFQSMLDDISDGVVGTVVTKDLSRLGRDYLSVGQYTEIFFPTHGIRYIAVYDNVDTENTQVNDFAAIKNVMNEFYSRDNSRKIKAAITSRSIQGKYRATVPPYGYLKDPRDHNHLVIDKETAPYVRVIFDLVLKGWGNRKVRDYLKDNKVPVPSWFHTERGWIDKSHMFPNEESKYLWRPDTLRLIIKNRAYCGDTVNCKTEHIFKTKKHARNSEDRWIIVEDTHEPIVSRDEWEQANKLFKVRDRECKSYEKFYMPNLFKGMLKCADCGKSLNRRKYGSKNNRMIYICGQYCMYGATKCSQHKIFEDDLIRVVQEDINAQITAANYDKRQMVKRIWKLHQKMDKYLHKDDQMSYKEANARLIDVCTLIDNLYEEHTLGALDEDNYQRMMEKYQDEQHAIQDRLDQIKLRGKMASQDKLNIKRFVDLISEVEPVRQLTPELLHLIIDHIDVHESEAIDGRQTQTLDIYYRYAGIVAPVTFHATRFYRTETVHLASEERASASA